MSTSATCQVLVPFRYGRERERHTLPFVWTLLPGSRQELGKVVAEWRALRRKEAGSCVVESHRKGSLEMYLQCYLGLRNELEPAWQRQRREPRPEAAAAWLYDREECSGRFQRGVGLPRAKLAVNGVRLPLQMVVFFLIASERV